MFKKCQCPPLAHCAAGTKLRFSKFLSMKLGYRIGLLKMNDSIAHAPLFSIDFDLGKFLVSKLSNFLKMKERSTRE